MRFSLSAVLATFVLLGCAVQQVAVRPAGQMAVCGAKAGDRQNYWNERDARLNGAVVVFQGECPAEPNSEGRMQ